MKQSLAQDQEVLKSVDALAQSVVSHQDTSIHKLRHQYDQACTARQEQFENFAKLDEEWQGVGASLPRLQEVLAAAGDGLTALANVTDRFVPVGADVEEEGDAFANQLVSLADVFDGLTCTKKCP